MKPRTFRTYDPFLTEGLSIPVEVRMHLKGLATLAPFERDPLSPGLKASPSKGSGWASSGQPKPR